MYLTAHAPSWRSETYRQQTLPDYVLPALGARVDVGLSKNTVADIVKRSRTAIVRALTGNRTVSL